MKTICVFSPEKDSFLMFEVIAIDKSPEEVIADYVSNHPLLVNKTISHFYVHPLVIPVLAKLTNPGLRFQHEICKACKVSDTFSISEADFIDLKNMVYGVLELWRDELLDR